MQECINILYTTQGIPCIFYILHCKICREIQILNASSQSVSHMCLRHYECFSTSRVNIQNFLDCIEEVGGGEGWVIHIDRSRLSVYWTCPQSTTGHNCQLNGHCSLGVGTARASGQSVVTPADRGAVPLTHANWPRCTDVTGQLWNNVANELNKTRRVCTWPTGLWGVVLRLDPPLSLCL